MKKIPLLEKKSFGVLLNDCLEFIIQNFIPYSKAFFILVLPPLLLVAAMMVPLYNNMVDFMDNLSHANRFDLSTLASFWTAMCMLFVLFLFFMAVSILHNTLTYQYVILYERMDDPSEISIAALWDGIKSSYIVMLSSFLWFLAFFFIYMIVSVALIIFISTVIRVWLLTGLFIVAWFIAYMYAIIPLSLFFFIRVRERSGPIDALARSFRLAYGHWWRSFGLIVLIAIIALVLQSICLAPLTSMTGTSTFPYTLSRHYDINAMRTPLFGITQAVSVLVSVFFSAFTGFVMCLNYYSLVSLTDPDPVVIEENAPAASESNESEHI